MTFGKGKGFDELFNEAFIDVTTKGETIVYENAIDSSSMLYIRKPSGKFYDAWDKIVEDADRLEFLIGEGILVKTAYTDDVVFNNKRFIITDGNSLYSDRTNERTDKNDGAIWANKNFSYDDYLYESDVKAMKAIQTRGWLETGVFVEMVMVKPD